MVFMKQKHFHLLILIAAIVFVFLAWVPWITDSDARDTIRMRCSQRNWSGDCYVYNYDEAQHIKENVHVVWIPFGRWITDYEGWRFVMFWNSYFSFFGMFPFEVPIESRPCEHFPNLPFLQEQFRQNNAAIQELDAAWISVDEVPHCSGRGFINIQYGTVYDKEQIKELVTEIFGGIPVKWTNV